MADPSSRVSSNSTSHLVQTPAGVVSPFSSPPPNNGRTSTTPPPPSQSSADYHCDALPRNLISIVATPSGTHLRPPRFNQHTFPSPIDIRPTRRQLPPSLEAAADARRAVRAVSWSLNSFDPFLIQSDLNASFLLSLLHISHTPPPPQPLSSQVPHPSSQQLPRPYYTSVNPYLLSQDRHGSHPLHPHIFQHPRQAQYIRNGHCPQATS